MRNIQIWIAIFHSNRRFKILIDYASDIHFEFGGISELMFHPTEGWKPNPGSEVLVLAGDIVEVALLCNNSGRGGLVREAFQKWSRQYKHVLWVFGNHEYYGESLNYALPHARAKLQKNCCDNVTILNNTTLDINDVVFFGGTAWTDFNRFNPIDMMTVEGGLNDYKKISVYEMFGNYKEKRKLRADDIAPIHKGWRSKFDMFCGMETDKKKVLITHHAPSYLSVPTLYRGHNLNSGYAFELGNELSYSNIKLAIHGHCHGAYSDYKHGDCLVVSNTRGYFGHEASAQGFKPKQVEV